MASYMPGYDEERFVTSVNKNFLCLICFNVLRDPVMCSRNHHCFCRGCITKHLENSQRCPTCADPLTEETLTGAPPIVKDYLNELDIHCEYVNRGCQETVQLQHLDRHEATCGFQPVVCTNQGCGVTVSRRDLIHHESELCRLRKVKCHSCGEMSKTLKSVEKRIGTMETEIVAIEARVKTDMATNKTDLERKLDGVSNEVRGLKAALIEGFDHMKEVLVKIEDVKEEIIGVVRPGASGDKEKENIFAAGGFGTNSVEMFNWRENLWSPLQPMPEERYAATSFVYDSHVTVAGGGVDTMIGMNIDQHLDLSTHWVECPVKLPANLSYHSSVLYNDRLLLSGVRGLGGLRAVSDCIYELQLVPPHAVKILSRMTEARRFHSTELFDDSMVIVGGKTTDMYRDNLKSVLLFDVKKNGYRQLAPLPYEVSNMATVRWRENIIVLGGADKHGNSLDSVIIYNVKTGRSHMLPPMSCKRRGCAAVVVGNNVVVLGGRDGDGPYLKSVEAFNFDSYSWEQLPEMSEGRWFPTAVVV